jgi:hypothetical protein
LAGWFAETGCDTWVMRFFTQEPAAYARDWIQDTERLGPDAFAACFDDWMRYYEAQGIAAISGGLITMRRAAGRENWFRAEDAPSHAIGNVGEAIAQAFDLQDYLRPLSNDGALLAQRFQLAPGVCLDQQQVPGGPGWNPAATQLRRTRGLAYAQPVTPALAETAARCDGERRLADLLREVPVQSIGGPAAEVPIPLVRRLVERGFLLPAVT